MIHVLSFQSKLVMQLRASDINTSFTEAARIFNLTHHRTECQLVKGISAAGGAYLDRLMTAASTL